MKIAIFGSCVSRDTCEYMSGSTVLAYVARHSVTSLETPRGDGAIDLTELESQFQRRMVTRDLQGSGADQIVRYSDELDLVLIDLVDERRGFWQFPDGTSMTNSLEVESCGAARDARRAGARLVEFGSDQHFDRWRSGFRGLIDALDRAELLNRTIFVDVEWAAALDGAQHPSNDSLTRLGRRWRRIQRGAREANRSLYRGQGVADALSSMRNVKPTEAEDYADRALAANADYVRYREVVRGLVAAKVIRKSSDVRINRNHKWGPQPFHFRDQDYLSIVDSILDEVRSFGPRKDEST
ncbi:MAG: DUF6270 domain-containing protein [Brevibacterium aurantiacum]|uniref:DUF6270 domain-containing protein n=1 Tax=Brevibacterium aurantiacum TaxID=273384 RepID=UPI003F90E715